MVHAVLQSAPPTSFSSFSLWNRILQSRPASLEPMILCFLCAGTTGAYHHIQLHFFFYLLIQNYLMLPSVVAHTYNAYIQKAEARGL